MGLKGHYQRPYTHINHPTEMARQIRNNPTDEMTPHTPSTGLAKGLLSLSPLLFFVLFYIGSSLLAGDFYATPIIVSFLLTLIIAILTLKGRSMKERIDIVSAGASDHNIMLMIWIFVLAGSFASAAKYIGCIDATVQLAISLLPSHFLLAGIFLASCFLSISMGTSVGTIAALVPIASGLASHTSLPVALLVGIVVGGAYFGDNLSFISDTTIMATRTQGCKMKDKFRTNLRIVLPAALVALSIYLVMGLQTEAEVDKSAANFWLVLPYIIVLGTAIMGVDVLLVLLIGIFSTFVIGLTQGSFQVHDWMNAMSEGVLNLGELIIVTLMAGGLMAVLRENGGLDFIINRMFGHVRTRRKGECSIAGVVFMANLCTANNTIAILSVGSIAREIAQKCGVDPRKSASLLDTFSCLAQSIIPYGAQLLIASNLAGIGALEIIPYLFYPFLMAICAVLSIIIGFPKLKPLA